MGFLTSGKRAKADASSNNHLQRTETSIGANTTIGGTLKADGDLRVDGAFEGEIEVLGNVIVGATGRVIASIVATNIHISGAVKGDLVAYESAEISETGKVWGDITAKALHIEPGGLFHGKSDMTVADEPLLLEAPAAQGR